MSVVELIRKNREIGLNDDPQFNKAPRYDWRRYVPDRLIKVWADMSVESRVMVYLFAKELAEQALASVDD